MSFWITVCVPVSMCFKLIRIKMNERNAKYHILCRRIEPTKKRKENAFEWATPYMNASYFVWNRRSPGKISLRTRLVLVRWNANQKMDHTHHKAISVHQPCIWDVRKYMACAALVLNTWAKHTRDLPSKLLNEPKKKKKATRKIGKSKTHRKKEKEMETVKETHQREN